MSPIAVQTAPRRNANFVIEPVSWAAQEQAGSISSGRDSTSSPQMSNVRIEGVRPQPQKSSGSSFRPGSNMYNNTANVTIQGVGSSELYGQPSIMRYPNKYDRSSPPIFHDSFDIPRRSPALRTSTEPPMPPSSWKSESPRPFYYEKTVTASPVRMNDEFDKSASYDKVWSQAEKEGARVTSPNKLRDLPRRGPLSPPLEDPKTLQALSGEGSPKAEKSKRKHRRTLSAEEQASAFQEIIPSSPYNSDYGSSSAHGSASPESRCSDDRLSPEGTGKKIVRFESDLELSQAHSSTDRPSPVQTPERWTGYDRYDSADESDAPRIDARRNLPSNQRRVSSPKIATSPESWPFLPGSPREASRKPVPEEVHKSDRTQPSSIPTYRPPFQDSETLVNAGMEKVIRPAEDRFSTETVQIGYLPHVQQAQPHQGTEPEKPRKSTENSVTVYRPPFQDAPPPVPKQEGHSYGIPKVSHSPESWKHTEAAPGPIIARKRMEPGEEGWPQNTSAVAPSIPRDKNSQAEDDWPQTSAAAPSIPRNYSGSNLAAKAELPKHPLSISQLPPPTPPPQLLEQTAAYAAMSDKRQRNRLRKRGHSVSDQSTSKMGTFEVRQVRRVTVDIPDEWKTGLPFELLPKPNPGAVPVSEETSPKEKETPFELDTIPASTNKTVEDQKTREEEKAEAPVRAYIDKSVEEKRAEDETPVLASTVPPVDKKQTQMEQPASPSVGSAKSESKFRLSSAIASYVKPAQSNGVERSKTTTAPPNSYPSAAEKPSKARRKSFRTSGLFGHSSTKVSSEGSQNDSRTSFSSNVTDTSVPTTPIGRSPFTSRDSSPMRHTSDPTGSTRSLRPGSAPNSTTNIPNIIIDAPSIPPIPSIPAAHRTSLPSSSSTSALSSLSNQPPKTYPPAPGGHQWVSTADLAAFNNSASEVIIFRRFDAVHKRVLLDMTERIVSMEAELHNLDTLLGRTPNAASTDPSPTTTTTSSSSASSTKEKDTPQPTDLSALKSKRRDLLAALKSLLNDYDDLLIKFDSLRVLSPADQKTSVSKFKTWLTKNQDSSAATNLNFSSNSTNNSNSNSAGASTATAAAKGAPRTSKPPIPAIPMRSSTVPAISISHHGSPSPEAQKIDPQLRIAAAAIMQGKSATNNNNNQTQEPRGEATAAVVVAEESIGKGDVREESKAAVKASGNLLAETLGGGGKGGKPKTTRRISLR